VAVLIADTGYELYAACETVRDPGQLYSDLGMEDEKTDDAMHSVCDPELPEAGEVWSGDESVVEPDNVGNDVGRESVTLIYIHWRILPIMGC
jgi:hypothetical protein